jgi:hypothetical protein
LLNSQQSAEVGLCNFNDSTRNHLARDLITAALNCIVTTDVPLKGADCSNTPLYAAAFAACNTACASGTDAQVSACQPLIDCLNNGGFAGQNADGSFFCGGGTCSDNGQPCTSTNLSLCQTPATATCNMGQSCTDSLPPAFGNPPGPAGSSNECNDAKKSSCTIFGGCQ